MISRETIEAVKQAVKIVDLVAETTTVKRMGSRFVALCPFHSERTPSFSIREDQNSYHCFGCGKSGNIFSFLMETKSLSFPEAVEELAVRYGVPIKRERGGSDGKSEIGFKRKLFRINSFAQHLFQSSLTSDVRARRYLASRGLKDETITKFGLGVAPQERDVLSKILKGKKISDEELLQTGLVRRNDRGFFFDIFAGRITFPVWADSKRIVAFGGRLIPGAQSKEFEERMPKYLNSPETPVYHKSKTLFGFPQAQQAIRQTREVFVVEGYLDVISLSQAGVGNVVACCGTALADSHVDTLARVARKILLLFDGDTAGKTAASRSFRAFLNSRIDGWVVYLPEGEDPDTFSRKFGDKTASELSLLPRRSVLDAFIDGLLEQFSVTSVKELGPSSKVAVIKEVMQMLSQVKDSLLRDELIGRAAFRLQLKSEQFLSNDVIVNPTSMLQEEQKAVLGPIRAVNELPKVDQELLLCVMALRGDLPKEILSDATLCSNLSPETLGFIQELEEALSISNSDDDVLRERIRAILLRYGNSWLSHWRKAYKMLQSPETKLHRGFQECVLSLKRAHIREMLNDLTKRATASVVEGERELLAEQQLALAKELKRLNEVAFK